MTTYSLNDQFKELAKVTVEEKKQMEQNNDTVTMTDESEKIQVFFQSNKDKKERKYTTKWIKSTNFLSNIAYVGINREDFYNEDFIFDVYLLITNNLNTFLLDRKLSDKNRHEMLYMLWKECMLVNFCQQICKEKRLIYLNRKNVQQSKVTEIINEYLDEDTNIYNKMRNNLSQCKNIFQYVHSNIFPEIHCSTERQGFDLKSSCHIMFKTYKDKKRWSCSAKTPQNYQKYVIMYLSVNKNQ